MPQDAGTAVDADMRAKAMKMLAAIEDALGSADDEQVVLTAVRNGRLGGVFVTAVSLRDCEFDDYLAGRLDAAQASLGLRSLPAAIETAMRSIMAETMAENGSATCQITWPARQGDEPAIRTPDVDDDLVSLSLSSMMDAFARRFSGGVEPSEARH